MLLIIHLKECFSVSRAAPVVDIDDRITVVDEMLNLRIISDSALTKSSWLISGFMVSVNFV